MAAIDGNVQFRPLSQPPYEAYSDRRRCSL